MLHTALLTSLSAAPALLPSQEFYELAALSPVTPATGVWFFDFITEAYLWTQLGLLTTVPELSFTSGIAPSLPWLSLVTQLSTAAASAYASAWVSSLNVGVALTGLTIAQPSFIWVYESVDFWLILAELVAASWLVLRLSLNGQFWMRVQSGYDAILTLCQQRGISIAEVFSLVTFMLGYLVFDMFVITAEDDLLEAVSYVFGGIICAALVLLALAVDIQYYYMISAISGGEATLRVLYTDIVNNGLCLLRVFFCWIRYLFYDLQAELVDFAFHYTETGDETALEQVVQSRFWVDAGLSFAELSLWTGGLLTILLDAGVMLVQLLIGGFKLALALFLFWLILDLFLLRTIARAETVGWAKRRQSIIRVARRVGWRYRSTTGWRAWRAQARR